MANISIKFAGLTFSNNIVIASIAEKERLPVRIHSIPKTDGSVAEEANREKIQLAIKGSVNGANYDATRSDMDTLKAAFYSGIQKLTKDDERYIMAQLASFSWDNAILRTLRKFNATFEAHYPFWLSETLYTVEKTEGVDMTSGASYVVNNAGNAPARLKVEITAPGGGISDNLQMENLTRGGLFKYRGDIAASKKLEVDNRFDTDDFEVLNDGSDDHTNFEGDFLMLDPGDNDIEYTGEAGAVVKLSYRATWY